MSPTGEPPDATGARAEAYYRALIDSALDIIAVLGPDGTIRYASPSVTPVLGHLPEALVGRNVTSLVHPGDLETTRAALALAAAGPGDAPTAELRIRHKDGGWRILEAVGRNLVDDPIVGGIVVNARDVTERRRHERELQAIVGIAAALRGASTKEDMAAVVLDQADRTLAPDGAGLALRDPISGAIVFEHATGLMAPFRGRAQSPGTGLTSRVLSSGQAFRREDGAADGDGHTADDDVLGGLPGLAGVPLVVQQQAIGVLWVASSDGVAADEMPLLTAIADIAASAIYRAGLLATLERRVDERTRDLAAANERLQELDRLKSKFVSEVSHELRTPVANIVLYLSLLDRGKPDKRERYFAVLREQATRLAALVEDILNLSRLEAQAAGAPQAPVDLNEVVTHVAAAHRLRAEALGLDLAVELDPGLPEVFGRREALTTAVTNLLANALGFTPSGRVVVRTLAQADAACVEVEDTGMGIPEEDRPHIFDRFYRGQRAGELNIPGSGLGLAIVRQVVLQHGGRIDVRAAERGGSVFRICLRGPSALTPPR